MDAYSMHNTIFDVTPLTKCLIIRSMTKHIYMSSLNGVLKYRDFKVM